MRSHFRTCVTVATTTLALSVGDVWSAEIAFWRMQEAGSGAATTLNDSAGSRHFNNVLSSPNYSTASMPVAPNGTAVAGNTAYTTDYASGQGLYNTAPGFLDDTTYTFEVLYSRANADVSSNFFGNNNANHYNGIGRVGVNGDGDVVLQLIGADIGTSGNTAEEFTIAGPDDAGWHHFAYTINGTTLTTFVDYQQVSQTTLQYYTNGRIFSDFAYLTVGFANETSNGSLGAFWSGSLDEIRISDQVLSSSEFLGAIPEPSASLLCAGAALLFARRPRRGK